MIKQDFKAKTTDHGIRNMLFETQAEADLADALWNIQGDHPMDINDFYRFFKFTLRMAGADSAWAD